MKKGTKFYTNYVSIKGKTLSRGVLQILLPFRTYTFWILNNILCLKHPQSLGKWIRNRNNNNKNENFFKRSLMKIFITFSFHRFPSHTQCGNFAQEWILIYASVLYKIVSFVLVPTSTHNYSVLDFVLFFFVAILILLALR